MVGIRLLFYFVIKKRSSLAIRVNSICSLSKSGSDELVEFLCVVATQLHSKSLDLVCERNEFWVKLALLLINYKRLKL